MFQKRVNSFRYAFQGIRFLFASQTNARIHALAALLVIIMGFTLDVSNSEWCVLALTIGFVIAAEGFNTAIEKLTDLSSPNHNTEAGQIKDIAAASVLISAIAAVIVGILIFLPKLI